MKLVGLSGTNGAGKDSVAEVLRDKHNFMFVSVSDLLRDEAKIRGLPPERKHLSAISAEWRRKSGLGVLIDKSIELYESAGGDDVFSGLVVSSIRNPGEIDRVHELGGELVWVDADAKIRYDRIFSRGRHDDNKSFEQFLEEQAAEMTHSGDAATLSMGDVKDRADRVLLNEGSTLEELDRTMSSDLEDLL